MKKLFLAMLIQAAKALVTGPLYNRIKELVQYQMTTGLTGEQRKKAVWDAIKAFEGDLKVTALTLSTNLINLAIEVAVAAAKK